MLTYESYRRLRPAHRVQRILSLASNLPDRINARAAILPQEYAKPANPLQYRRPESATFLCPFGRWVRQFDSRRPQQHESVHSPSCPLYFPQTPANPPTNQLHQLHQPPNPPLPHGPRLPHPQHPQHNTHLNPHSMVLLPKTPNPRRQRLAPNRHLPISSNPPHLRHPTSRLQCLHVLCPVSVVL